MPATVINGVFQPSGITWHQVVGAGPFDGFAPIPNFTNSTFTINGSSIIGTNSGDFALTAGQLPVTVNPGQSALIHVTFTPGAAGTRVAQINFTTDTGYSPFLALQGFKTTVVTPGQAFPDSISFPTTKVGSSSTFANFQIVNLASTLITVSNIAMLTGTNFFIVGAPVVPFTIPSGGSSAVFSVQFTPLTPGFLQDNLQITTSGGGGVTISASLGGVGSALQSAFNLTGGQQGSLFAFPNAGNPLILLSNPNSLNCEEAGSFVKLHDMQIINMEKKVMRIRGHYEDLGPATVSFKLRSRRVGKPDDVITVPVAIGTAFADGWIREFTSEPTPVSGELVQLTCSRAANSGPASIIDYTPEFEPAGEVIGGT